MYAYLAEFIVFKYIKIKSKNMRSLNVSNGFTNKILVNWLVSHADKPVPLS